MDQQNQTPPASQPTPPSPNGSQANSTVQQLRNALRILRMKQLQERTRLSRATLYVLMAKDPTFPRKVKLSARCVGFFEEDVNAWLSARIQATPNTLKEAA